MLWWTQNIEYVNGFTLKVSHSVQAPHFDEILHSDASGKGMYLDRLGKEATTLVSKPFSEFDCHKAQLKGGQSVP